MTIHERYPSPDVQYKELFEAVQLSGIFSDSKTFVDCIPKAKPKAIMEAYRSQKKQTTFELKAFVFTHFELPKKNAEAFHSDIDSGIEAHIERLWAVLSRAGDTSIEGNTLFALPKPYIVPGGRFGEIYYWDSYFTMLGLHASGRGDLIADMVENFAHLIDLIGFIPNGNRTYYLSRSQPPFFSLMLDLFMQTKQLDRLPYLKQLDAEYRFWMDGADKLEQTGDAYRRVVRLEGGLILNRYWDDVPSPRPESFKEDIETAHASDIPNGPLYTHICAACESGWDFSSRWNADATLNHIHTTDILPVDLNCLLWNMERLLAAGYAQKEEGELALFFKEQAMKRKKAIQNLFFSESEGCFMDYNFMKKSQTGVFSAAMAFPLFFELHLPEQGKSTCFTLREKLLRPGGIVTTNQTTGQQWDAPNGWAPLQWICYIAARNAKQLSLAKEIKKRWMHLNQQVFLRTGKMLEKYNVEDLSLEAGGGEYPVQDGFGWTNGVYMALLHDDLSDESA